MKKVYRSDLGSLVFVGLGASFFLGGALLSFLAFGGASLGIRVSMSFCAIFSIFFFYLLLKYEVIITDNEISSKNFVLPFLNKYQTMKFGEIGEVWNAIGPFSDMPGIVFKSYDKSKKPMAILVGFGLPWQALFDILERLPKDTKINFEPLLWKRIKNPPKLDTPKRLLITASILVLLILSAFLYSWWDAFVVRKP